MTSKKTETVSADTHRARSVARGELGRRIAAKEAARATVEEKEGAARRLAMTGETARALAAQLAGLKAHAAAKLADHVLRGTGRPPALANDGREDVAERLAQAEAIAEAAGPAAELVQVEIGQAHAEHNCACGAIEALIVPVFEEELDVLEREIRSLTDKLIPLHASLMGLRNWAVMRGAGKREAERGPFLRLSSAAKDTMDRCLVSPGTPSKGTEASVWDVAAERLPTDPDFPIASHAEAA